MKRRIFSKKVLLVLDDVNHIDQLEALAGRQQEAICLFSRYAFGTENPVEGYNELSGKVVRYAAGLPLTIKVLGSFLRGKDMDDWEDAIERLKDIPFLEKLELSYIGLKNDYTLHAY
nr:disease resistance protein (TIR-NBS-LRR class) family [Tanacetum cinerariifolium]